MSPPGALLVPVRKPSSVRSKTRPPEDRAGCAGFVAPHHLHKKRPCLYRCPGFVSVSLQNSVTIALHKGEDPVRRPMCPLGSRARYAEASLGGYLAGTVSGAAKVEEPAEDPDRVRGLQGCGPRREACHGARRPIATSRRHQA